MSRVGGKRGSEANHNRRMHPLTDNQSTLRRTLRIILNHQWSWDSRRTALAGQRGHDDAVGEVHVADA